ncbi:membrane-spanning 4-domains subfamily A member 3 isoform X2 [Tupaia chinensis]|uniref:membrane-spanning 4-domains subfamily A member 3 isoform X2 n=1 Tax=Tupaia chinensis TaxID=246437 RepID=UPI000FFBD377|nr:membrane-spanning 4-domains subfamily A member 3 isoform X2 [Tupaia chinensis]
MASQEVDNAELGTASAGGTPDSQEHPEGVNNSPYQPIEGSQDYQKAILQALGAIQVLNGAMILAFISSGSLSIAAGRKPTRTLMQNSFGMNIASATIALVGIVFLSINLAVNILSLKSCQSSQSPDLCIYMGSSSNGLVSLMLILTLLELCITISVSAMWCKANCCDSRQAISSPHNSVEPGIPPDKSNSESMNIQPQVSNE